MRLCFISREFPPLTPQSGGIGTQFAALSLALAARGHDIHFLTEIGSRRDSFQHRGVHVHLTPDLLPGPAFFIKPLVRAVQVARKMRSLGAFDAVFAAEWDGEAAVYARSQPAGPLASNLATSLQQIETLTPGAKPGRRVRLLYRIQRVLERSQTRRSTAIITPTDAVLAWSRELWDLRDVPSVTLPNLVSVSRVRSLAESDLPQAFPVERPVVAFAGRLEPRKGVHVLIEAMRTVWHDYPNAQVVLSGADRVWGSGPMSAHLLAIAGEHANRVHFLGPQPAESLFPIFRAADVVVLPSLWENFPLVALEAMAAGAALVVTNAGGYREFMSDGGDCLMAGSGDPDEFASAICRLLSSTALAEDLRRAAAQAVERFDAARVVPAYEQAFEVVSQIARDGEGNDHALPAGWSRNAV